MLPWHTPLVRVAVALGALAALGTLVGCGTGAHPAGIASDGAIDLPPIDDFQFPPLPDTGPVPDGGTTDASDASVMDAGDVDPDAAVTDAPTGDAPGDALGDATAAPFCGFTSDQMNQLAVRIATCTGGSPQQFLERFYRPEQWQSGPFAARPCDVLQCAVGARTCVDVLSSCLKYTATALPDGGMCPGPSPRCDGHFASHCDNGRTINDDCEAIGGRCVASSTESACAPARGDPCSATATTRCNGAVAERCISGVFVPMANCALTASRCDPTAGACVGTGDACTGDTATCDGTALRRCLGGHIQPLDCGALVRGAACHTVGGASFCGVGTACDPSAAPPGGRCEGNVVVLCAGGQALRYDCVANGFTACGATGCVP